MATRLLSSLISLSLLGCATSGSPSALGLRDSTAMVASTSSRSIAAWRAGARAAGDNEDSIDAFFTRQHRDGRAVLPPVTLPATYLPDSMYAAVIRRHYRAALTDSADCASILGMRHRAGQPLLEPEWFFFDLGYAFGLWQRGAEPVIRSQPDHADRVAYVRLITRGSALAPVGKAMTSGHAVSKKQFCAFGLAAYRLAAEHPGQHVGRWTVLALTRRWEVVIAKSQVDSTR